MANPLVASPHYNGVAVERPRSGTGLFNEAPPAFLAVFGNSRNLQDLGGHFVRHHQTQIHRSFLRASVLGSACCLQPTFV